MSLLYTDVGATCFVAGCNQYDLLPTTCPQCGVTTCDEHKDPESHGCLVRYRYNQVPVCSKCDQAILVPVESTLSDVIQAHVSRGCPTEPKSITAPRKTGCDFPGCTQRDVVNVMCSMCTHCFCIAHRLEEDHHCPLLPGRKGDSSPSRPRTTDELPGPFFLWRFANTMDTHIGDSSIPEPQRFGLRVFFEGSLCILPHYMFFPATAKAGKVLDIIARVAGLRNSNNSGEGEVLRLFHLRHSCPALPLSVPLIEQDGLKSGSGVMVGYGESLPTHVVNEVPIWIHLMRSKEKFGSLFFRPWGGKDLYHGSSSSPSSSEGPHPPRSWIDELYEAEKKSYLRITKAALQRTIHSVTASADLLIIVLYCTLLLLLRLFY